MVTTHEGVVSHPDHQYYMTDTTAIEIHAVKKGETRGFIKEQWKIIKVPLLPFVVSVDGILHRENSERVQWFCSTRVLFSCLLASRVK